MRVHAAGLLLASLGAALFVGCDEQNECDRYCADAYDECIERGRHRDTCTSDRIACEQRCIPAY